MAEYWFLRHTTGGNCGATTRRIMTLTSGASAQEYSLQPTYSGISWNRQESDRSIEAGDWKAYLWLKAGAPGLSVTARIRRVNSACVTQETIMEKTVSPIQEGSFNAYAFIESGYSQVDFAAGDYIILEAKASAPASVIIRYDWSAAQQANSRIHNPDEYAPPPGHVRGLEFKRNLPGSMQFKQKCLSFEERDFSDSIQFQQKRLIFKERNNGPLRFCGTSILPKED